MPLARCPPLRQAQERARIRPGQIGADPGRVENDQGLRRDGLDSLGKGSAFGGDIGTHLLTRPERLFVRVKPTRLRVTQSPGRLTRTPVCAAGRAPYSARVASLSAATTRRSTARSAAPRRGSGPCPRGLATRRRARTRFIGHRHPLTQIRRIGKWHDTLHRPRDPAAKDGRRPTAFRHTDPKTALVNLNGPSGGPHNRLALAPNEEKPSQLRTELFRNRYRAAGGRSVE